MPLVDSALGVADPASLSRDISQAVQAARQARAVGTVLPTATIRPADTIRPSPRVDGAPAARVETVA